MRILIAEDDLTSRMMLAALLEKYGYEVIMAPDGQEAWNLLNRAEAPRLAILDWMMPGMDGVDLVKKLRAESRALQPYLILLTTKGEKEDVVEGLEAGADDYLVKPFHPAELRARVEVGRRLIDAQDRLVEQVRKLREALEDIKTLQGILPICMHCKKIRNDKGYWEQVEAYIERHSDALFSHSICPDCMRKFCSDDVPDDQGNARETEPTDE